MVVFDTMTYEFSHGKKPRGHGMWAFHFQHAPKDEFWFCPVECTYMEAKKWAREQAKTFGARRGELFVVKVLP